MWPSQGHRDRLWEDSVPRAQVWEPGSPAEEHGQALGQVISRTGPPSDVVPTVGVRCQRTASRCAEKVTSPERRGWGQSPGTSGFSPACGGGQTVGKWGGLVTSALTPPCLGGAPSGNTVTCFRGDTVRAFTWKHRGKHEVP